MKDYRIVNQIFLALSLLGLLAAVFARFAGPILTVSQVGFFRFTDTCLLFVIAISLTELAFVTKKTS